MITKKQIPVWPQDWVNYFDIYNKIIQNFERAFDNHYPDSDILFVDNTYKNAQEVVEIIHSAPCDVVAVFSLLDPPYTWHYLKEVLDQNFPNIIKRYVGSESPDIALDFWWLWCIQQMPRYSINELLPTKFNRIFLSYNSKPHVHRVALINELQQNNLSDLGSWTLDKLTFEEIVGPTMGSSLGDLDVWQHSFLNIVGSTVFRLYNDPLILSEKEFKPIVGLRPMLINGSPRYYKVLRDQGFDVFEDLLPIQQLEQERPTVEETMKQCHQLICSFVQDLVNEPLHLLYEKMLPRLLENQKLYVSRGQQLTKQWCHEPIDLKKS